MISNKSTRKYLALLRGINVGGKNLIKMPDLKVCFEKMSFKNITTYIQSGNVIFTSTENDIKQLTQKIENVLSETFSYKSKIVLLTSVQVSTIVNEAPNGFGAEPEEYKYDVLFLRDSIKASEAMKSMRPREGVDSIYEGPNVIYFSRLISRAGQSYLSEIISLPIYKEMTIRNWNTTSKLYTIMNESK